MTRTEYKEEEYPQHVQEMRALGYKTETLYHYEHRGQECDEQGREIVEVKLDIL